jgi:16S rRNA (guanine527-N7)-methyltransferase
MERDRKMTFSERLENGANALKLAVLPHAFPQFETHQKLLEQWAPRVNLVGNADANITVETHFLDALALLRLLEGTTSDWTDIGSGAGFPGLPLATARPQWSFHLIEPLGKRASFLQQVIAQAGLSNTTLSMDRCENLEKGRLSGVISRAVFPPPKWLEFAGGLAKPQGWVVLMSATEPDEETLEAARVAGLVEVKRDSFSLPRIEAPRLNLLYQKTTG